MLLNFRRAEPQQAAGPDSAVVRFLRGFSIEVMPRTARKIADFRALLPRGTRVYIAHIDGTPIDEMVATARRLNEDGFPVMPHIPARLIVDKAMLADWIARYRGEADVRQALIVAGGVARSAGAFDSSMDLLETGLFDGFERLHVAGHPEGSRDIDPDGGERMVMDAARWKQAFSERTDARMAMATQFCFAAKPVIGWAERLKAAGIDLPVHVGIAGPAKLQTMIKFAIACGVGPSLRVLQKRALDVTKLLLPYEPDEVVTDLAAHVAANPGCGIEVAHLFPMGGIENAANWVADRSGRSDPMGGIENAANWVAHRSGRGDDAVSAQI